MTIEDVKKSIRTIPDFPQKGIIFKDLTTAFKSPEIFEFIVDQTYQHYKGKGITKVVGIESRGFILGAALAYRLGAGIALIRKPNKLPSVTYSISYSLEYGTDSLEIHTDALSDNDIVLLHDDLLATGGTANAALDLIGKFNVQKQYLNFIIELTSLNRYEGLARKAEVFSLIKY